MLHLVCLSGRLLLLLMIVLLMDGILLLLLLLLLLVNVIVEGLVVRMLRIVVRKGGWLLVLTSIWHLRRGLLVMKVSSAQSTGCQATSPMILGKDVSNVER